MPQEILIGNINNPNSSGANLYAFPSGNSAVKQWIPNGSEIVVYNRQPDWSVVGFGDNVGYVQSEYVFV